MGLAMAFFVSACFLISVCALYAFIWSIGSESQEDHTPRADVIFDEGELGRVEDPALDDKTTSAISKADDLRSSEDIRERILFDTSSRLPVLAFISSALFWLVIGSIAGLLASVKLHMPDLWTGAAELTFGRVRPVHLNAVAYGWGSMAGIGIVLWLLPRILKTPLVGSKYAVASAAVWNLALAIGLTQLLLGMTDGKEFLEIPWTTDILFVIGGGLAAVPLFLTLLNKKAGHIYVSGWYFSAALVWFPLLFLMGNMPGLFYGAEQAILNWWFGHNVLGLWVTPIAVGTAYYFIPKILGVPVHSYRLSLIGFWSLALFYSQVGVHHLIGGPVPYWLQTLSIVQSVMMIVPVAAFTFNMFTITRKNFGIMKSSFTLRFILIGAVCYLLSSVQGSLEAVRAMNYLVHFTHYTVAHAHLGLYSFFTMILFGAIYFVVPRATGVNWVRPKLISLHFWLVFIGMLIYIVFLTIGGIVQGLALQDPNIPFGESTAVSLPYLEWRSVGGTLMTFGHLVIAYHLYIHLRHVKRLKSSNVPRPQSQEVTS
ncbi:cbb3-type cytochrome c oxidase subunit I [Parasalinivibrio latis]|uniref:cbb3-type cytochrome c oxidase subunit I n=1 Tax=Parasalinivibrio latis TaxID=2952610 RepID=UPI0030DFA0B9